MRILERIGARNDLARAMVTRAALRQAAGDLARHEQLLDQAQRFSKHSAPSTNRPGSKRHVPRLTDGSPIGLFACRS